MRARAQQLVERFRVKTAGLDAPIASLSGGNVQRVVQALIAASKSDCPLSFAEVTAADLCGEERA